MRVSILSGYLVICALVLQYILHEPLSYLTKQWFWAEPHSVKNINAVLAYLPQDASVVSQNNITPHISHRDNVFTLWPDTIGFAKNSPCGQKDCRWFHWAGNPQYLVVDTASDCAQHEAQESEL